MKEAYYVGQVITAVVNKPIKGFLYCDGSERSTHGYMQLYYLLGNRYGGTAPDTFKLPDYREQEKLFNGLYFFICYEGNHPGLNP